MVVVLENANDFKYKNQDEVSNENRAFQGMERSHIFWQLTTAVF